MPSVPAYIVIGAQRAGTTSLYDYMTKHPRLVGAHAKEVHFFDINYDKGAAWYRERLIGDAEHRVTRHLKRPLYGEATPYYLPHPAVPQRIAETCPDAKLIALLREPVARAYSQFQNSRKRGREELATFEEAIDAEAERLAGEEERLLADPAYRSFSHRHHSYVTRGRYADQLERWFAHFPREQLLIVPSESLFTDPATVVRNVFDFVGVKPVELERYEQQNASDYPSELGAATRDRLREFFRPHNERLFAMLGRDFGWND